MKYLFDFFFSMTLIIILLPIICLISILVYLSDFNNPFYFSKRVGKSFKEFKMFKFRTMIVNADKTNVFSTKKDDKRITKLGNILRNYKLDELPQLFNVIIGQMSFVGPRPNVVFEVKNYNSFEKEILKVKPGITDLASIIFNDEGEILRKSNNPNKDYQNFIQPWKGLLGLIYIKEKNFKLDFIILVLTIISVFNKNYCCKFISNFLKSRKYNKIISEFCLRKKNIEDFKFTKDLYNI